MAYELTDPDDRRVLHVFCYRDDCQSIEKNLRGLRAARSPQHEKYRREVSYLAL